MDTPEKAHVGNRVLSHPPCLLLVVPRSSGCRLSPPRSQDHVLFSRGPWLFYSPVRKAHSRHLNCAVVKVKEIRLI